MEYLFLIIGIILVVLGANWTVDGASSIAKKFGISDLVIGLTVVALGTSAPELVVNIVSAINGSTGLALGNVVGSNIANILLILGITALVKPIPIKKNTKWIEIPFNVFAVVILILLANDSFIDNSGCGSFISRTDGLIMLLFMGMFLIYTYKTAKKGIGGAIDKENFKVTSFKKSIFLIIAGLSSLIIGGDLLVNNAVKIASFWGLSDKIIGLTIIAIGTSLPELATSIAAALKGKTDIAVGNIVGSNIFNILFILGITSIIKEIPLGMGTNYDLFVMFFASILLFITAFSLKKNSIDRTEGAIFLFIYIIYIVTLLI